MRQLPGDVLHKAPRQHAGEIILDVTVDDVDAKCERIKILGVERVMPPTP